MKLAQDYLKETSSGNTLGGFNSRLQGLSLMECNDGVPSGSIWGQRYIGWDLAHGMIEKGKIFSLLKTESGEVEFKCFPDGDQWCCVGPEFENLQESDGYTFADSRKEAIEKFVALTAPTI